MRSGVCVLGGPCRRLIIHLGGLLATQGQGQIGGLGSGWDQAGVGGLVYIRSGGKVAVKKASTR